jgi:putative transposase
VIASTTRACAAVRISRATYYRHTNNKPADTPDPHLPPARATGRPALRQEEQEQILQELYSERFVDCSPRQVYATLLDEGVYLCSWRSMYRLLKHK